MLVQPAPGTVAAIRPGEPNYGNSLGAASEGRGLARGDASGCPGYTTALEFVTGRKSWYIFWRVRVSAAGPRAGGRCPGPGEIVGAALSMSW